MLVFGAMNASAQLTVYHNGNVNIGSEQPTSNVSLSVGNVAYSDTAYHVSLGLHNPASGCYLTPCMYWTEILCICKIGTLIPMQR